MNDTTANGKPPVYNSSTTAPDQRGVQVPDDREKCAPGTLARVIAMENQIAAMRAHIDAAVEDED